MIVYLWYSHGVEGQPRPGDQASQKQGLERSNGIYHSFHIVVWVIVIVYFYHYYWRYMPQQFWNNETITGWRRIAIPSFGDGNAIGGWLFFKHEIPFVSKKPFFGHLARFYVD
jgi:hypothetical protein